jgi:predicted ester cyclase
MSSTDAQVSAAVSAMDRYRGADSGEIGAALVVVGLSAERAAKEAEPTDRRRRNRRTVSRSRSTTSSNEQDGAMSENLKLLGEYSAAMEAGDEDAVFSYWAPEFRSHVTARVNPDVDGTDIRGEELRWWTQVRSAFPDMVFSVELLIEKDDLIVSNWTVKGTHTGTAFYELPASGEPIEINGTAILRMRDGKIVEHWGGPHCQRGLGLVLPPR